MRIGKQCELGFVGTSHLGKAGQAFAIWPDQHRVGVETGDDSFDVVPVERIEIAPDELLFRSHERPPQRWLGRSICQQLSAVNFSPSRTCKSRRLIAEMAAAQSAPLSRSASNPESPARTSRWFCPSRTILMSSCRTRGRAGGSAARNRASFSQ